jgi:cytochrome P450
MRIFDWVSARPRLLRSVFALLRSTAPVLVLGRVVVVTRIAEIRAVLERDMDFAVRSDDRPVMLDGPFVLRMDRSPQYLQEIDLLRRIVTGADLQRIRALVAAEARERTQGAASGHFDVVTNLTDPVGVRLITDYLGVPLPAEGDLLLWLRRLAAYIVTSGFHDPADAARAETAAQALRRHVEAVIAARREALAQNPSAVGDDVLSRLIRISDHSDGQVDADMVRRNITGLLIVSHAVVVKALALAVDELLRHPAALTSAQTAAAAGDIAAVTQHAFEALRFNPVFPILTRFSPRPSGLVDRRGRQHRFPAGTTIIVALLSGMFDAAVFLRPDDFAVDRNLRDYLVFGHGMHTCFGRHIAEVEVPEMLLALLKLRNLRRAPGEAGKLRFDGPAVDRLLLEFDP